MSQGIYREGGAAAGLPFVRVRLGVLTAIVLALAALAIVMPPMLLVVLARGTGYAWRMLKDAGAGAYVLLLLDVLLPVALAALGAYVVRGKRVPPALLVVVAALPLGLSMVLAALDLRRIHRLIEGDMFDGGIAVRIASQAVAETMALDALGGLVACGCAIVACVAAASAVASIASDAPASKPAVAASAVWAIATVALAVTRLHGSAGARSVLAVLVVVTLAPFAALAARAAPALRRWHDAAEARHAASALLAAGACALLAVVAIERTIEMSESSRAFGAIVDGTADPAMKARILAEAVDARAAASIAYAVHGVLGAVALGVALAAAGRAPSAAGVGATLGIALGLAVGAQLLDRARLALPHELVARSHVDTPAGIALPVVQAGSAVSSSSREHAQLELDAAGNGHVKIVFDRGGRSPQSIRVFADRRASVVRLAYADWPSVPVELHLVVAIAPTPERDARLGALAPFVWPPDGEIGATFDERALHEDASYEAGGARVTVRVVSDDAVLVSGTSIELAGRRIAIPLRDDEPRDPSYEPRISRVRYVLRPTDTIDRAVQAVVAIETVYAARMSSYGVHTLFELQ